MAIRKNTLPVADKSDGTMKIAIETSYDSVGEDYEQLGRTYLRIREVGTFTSDTPYRIIRDKINETLNAERLRDKKSIDIIERSGERRKQIQR